MNQEESLPKRRTDTPEHAPPTRIAPQDDLSYLSLPKPSDDGSLLPQDQPRIAPLRSKSLGERFREDFRHRISMSSQWGFLWRPFFCAWYLVLQPFLTALDRFLLGIATLFGMTVVDTKRRYAVFGGRFVIIYASQLVLPTELAFPVLVIGFLGVIGISRAWARDERRREDILRSLQSGHPDDSPDLRGCALLAALQLMIIVPLMLYYTHQLFGLFSVSSNASWLSWVSFTFDGFCKSLLDWSEVFNVHFTTISYSTRIEQSVVFLKRLTFDFVLIQALLSLLHIHRTNRDAINALKKEPTSAERLGRRAFGLLVSALDESNAAVRANAARALGSLDDPRTVEPFVRVLQDTERFRTPLRDHKEHWVFREAVETLLKNRDDRAVDVLLKLLDDKIDPEIRRDAIHYLQPFKDERVFSSFVRIIREDNEAVVRQAAIDRLADLGDERAVPVLVEVIGKDTPERPSAILAFAKFDAPAAIPPLLQLLQHDQADIRRSATATLGKIGSSDAVEPVVKRMVEDEHPNVRSTAAEALGQIGDQGATKALVATLKGDTSVGVRQSAAKALGQLGDKSAVEVLIGALKDDSGICGEAVEALGKLGDSRAVEPLIRVVSKDSRLRHTVLVAIHKMNLTSLDLCGTSVGDADMKYLKRLKTLVTLNLQGTEVTAQGIAELREALPNCDVKGP